MATQTSGTYHVYSTLASPQRYQNYSSTASDLKIADGDGVLIHGGHSIAHQDRANGVYTPMGVRTEVTADQLAYLKNNTSFMDHEKRGHIKVMDRQVDTEKAAGDMKTRDESSPLVPQDHQGEIHEPVVNTKASNKK